MRTKLLVAVLAICAFQTAAPAAAEAAGRCTVTQRGPAWIDYSDRFVPFRRAIFRRPGITAAVSTPAIGREMRDGGANTVFWDMHLNKRVGTPRAPADPGVIAGRADRLYEYAVDVTACANPRIALNELFGAQLQAPWSATNAQYRANVLTLLRRLAARGARPALLISHPPATKRGVARWWRQVAAVSDIVREVYPTGPQVHAKGPVGGSRMMRQWIRKAITQFTGIGIPARRLGIALGFHSKPGVGGGRDGLQPSSAWFDVVKIQALAARRLAAQLRFTTIWSWGWAQFGDGVDPDKAKAACVYLWARDPTLCDGPRAAGPDFNASRTQGQAEAPSFLLDVLSVHKSRVFLHVIPVGTIRARYIYLQRRAPRRPWGSIRKVLLPPVGRGRVAVSLPRGWSSLRVVAVKPRGRPIRSPVRNVRIP